MGQPNAKRLQFNAITPLTSAVNDDRQTLNNTHFLKVGDVLEFWDQNASGCLETLIGTRTITGVCPDAAITLDSAIDLTVVTGSAVIRNRTIDDVHEALSRLFDSGYEAEDFLIQWSPDITAVLTDIPIIGQSTQSVSDASCFYAGDSWAIISDEGLAGTGLVISTDNALNKVVIDDNIDTSVLTNPKLINTSVDLKTQLMRLKTLIDSTNAPQCDENYLGDCDNTVFYTSQSYVVNSSKVYIDGIKKRRGVCGTLASLVNDTVNAEITFTSYVLGLEGNNISIEMLDPGGASQPLTVSVSGTFDGQDRVVSVSLETDGGSAIISTAKEVAEAINVHVDAKRLMYAVYGGDGSGVQSALVSTPLAGGLDDGTGDYCEMQVVENNLLEAYDVVSMHIRPDEANRLSCPPQESEEVDLCYGKAV